MKRTGDGTTATMGRVASSQSVDGIAYSAAWSPDGQYVAIGYDGTSTSFTANKIAIYKQSGDTFTRLSVTNQPALTTSVSGIAWSKDGNYLYLSVNASPSFLTIKRTGDAFAFQSNPFAPFGVTANAVAVHPNNNLISVGHALNQFVTHYQNDGSYLFVKANTNAINPLDKIIGIAKEAGTQGQSKRVDVLVGGSLLP
jgi:WD40 repeat protein